MKQLAHECECPHPDCEATLKVKNGLPAGEYQCLCHSCTVRVSWAYYQEHGYKPYLTLVERKAEP